MATNKYIILFLSLFVLLSCDKTKVNEEDTYQKVENYNGKIKKLSIYEYESDLEQEEYKAAGIKKTPIIQKGFNEYGKLTFSREFDLDFYGNTFKVKTDSFVYLQDTLLCKHNYSYVVVGKNELDKYLTKNNYLDYPHLVIVDSIKYEFDTNIKSKSFYSKIVSNNAEFDYDCYYDYRTYDKNGEIKYKEEYNYDKEKLVQITKTGDDAKVIKFKYTNDKLVLKEIFVNNKKTEIHKFINGKLSEFKSLDRNTIVEKFNEEGYETYFTSRFEDNNDDVCKRTTLYKDSASLRHDMITFNSGKRLMNFYKFKYPYYKDCNPKITVNLNLHDDFTGQDDLSGFFKKIRNNDMTKENLKMEVVKILKNHPNSEFKIIHYFYDNKDSQNNYLQVKKHIRKIDTRPEIYFIDDDDIFEFNDCKIIEKEIEYYK